MNEYSIIANKEKTSVLHRVFLTSLVFVALAGVGTSVVAVNENQKLENQVSKQYNAINKEIKTTNSNIADTNSKLSTVSKSVDKANQDNATQNKQIIELGK